MERLERGLHLGTQALLALAMQEPVALDGEDAAVRLQRREERPQPLGPEGHTPAENGEPDPGRADLPYMFLDDVLGRALGEEAEMGDQRRRPTLEPRRVDVEERAAPDGDDRRVRPGDEPVARQRDERRLHPEARERALAG